jgi:hypothetical protein
MSAIIVISILTETSVHILTFAPHTTRFFQVLDLPRFGVRKRRPRYHLPFDDDNATVRCIMKVYHDFTHRMAQPNILGAFQALGLEFYTKREPHWFLFDEEKLGGRAGFQEPWSVDILLDQLSDRRRIARFGWINKPA